MDRRVWQRTDVRLPVATVTLAAAVGLMFDAFTPVTVEATLFYLILILAGYLFPSPRAPLVLLLLAVPLAIAGRWLSVPEPAQEWEIWFNRGAAVVTLAVTACLVWYVRVLEQGREPERSRRTHRDGAYFGRAHSGGARSGGAHFGSAHFGDAATERSWATAAIVVTLAAAAGMVFDALTPALIEVTLFYLGVSSPATGFRTPRRRWR